MAEEWSVSGGCPECGSAISWVPSFIVVQGGDTAEIGIYRCLSCGAESGKLEHVVEHGRKAIEPMTNLGLGTPAANPVVGRGRVTLKEIIKRIAREVYESKLNDK
jgi:hypothetical protein